METSFAAFCLAMLVGLLIRQPMQPFSARGTLLALLAWQTVIFASAARSSFWNYRACSVAATTSPKRFAFRSVGHRIGLSEGEWRLARSHGLAASAAVALFSVAVLFAPTLEQIWRLDPLGYFLPLETLLPSQGGNGAAAQLVREANAVQRQDIETAVGLWDPQGVIRDDRFTPDVQDDDHVWSGIDGVRQRYQDEFRLRRYRGLNHQDLAVTLVGPDKAIIVNDLDAVIETASGTEHVRLPRTDRWTLIREQGRWRIVMLEINRAPVGPDGGHSLLRTAAR
jgi:hypothetical protein